MYLILKYFNNMHNLGNINYILFFCPFKMH